MPRVVDYPHASYKNALEIAAAVDYLGGSCSINSCAERLNKKVGGAFKSLVGAAIKHGLITSKKEVLSTTELFRVYKLAYDEQEKLNTLRKAFLLPQLYQKIYERFRGKELPVSMLDKLMIREFGVEETYGSRVAGYFVDGAKNLQMLDNGRLLDNLETTDTEPETFEVTDVESREVSNKEIEKGSTGNSHFTTLPVIDDSDTYTILIVGPGINSRIQINEEDDLVIMDATINKIRKKIKEGSR